MISSSSSSCGSNARRAGEVEHAQERQRHVAHLLVEIETVEIHRGQLAAHRADVDAGEAQVLGDSEVGRHRRVLEHRGETVCLGVARTPERDRLAVDLDRSGIGAQDAGEDLDERRLAGTVGAEEGVHLSRSNLQIDGAQRHHRAERLGDGVGLEQ